MALAAASTQPTGRDTLCRALAWLALGIVVVCGAALLLAGPGYRLGWWGLGAGLQAVRWSATIAAPGVLVALVALLLAWRSGAMRAMLIALLALLLGIAVAGPPVYLWRQAARLPHIHDISTDTANPPLFVAVLPLREHAPNSARYNPAVAEQQKAAYPDIAPVLLKLPPAQALQLAEGVARAMGWDVVAVVPSELRIEATATTLLFGFKDDVVIRVTPDSGGSRVDMRSESRIGGFDFGTNAKRVRTFMKKLESAEPGG